MTRNQNKIHLTQEGLEEVRKKYQKLINVKRPKIVARLAESRWEGDLSENNEYLQSRQELNMVDGQIAELEDIIKKVVVVDGNHGQCQQIRMGCRVTVQNGSSQEQTFCLVSEWEVDPSAKKISTSSLLGKSLLGKKIGEQVEIEAPAGKIVYTIIGID